MNELEWQHLEAVVQALIEAGNPRATPFQPSQGGWWCSMQGTIEPKVAFRLVANDARLDFDQDEDVISCRHCWASIFGERHLRDAQERHRAATG